MRWPDRRAPVVCLASLLFVLVTACGGGGATPSTASTTAEPPPAGQPAPSAAIGQATGSLLVVDASLLDLLPTDVGGYAMQASPDTAATMIGDADLARSASGLAVGVVIAPGDSGGDDLAVTSVVRLRPGVGTDAYYAAWRGAYDEAACAPAGGVASHAQQLIGARKVEVTLCAGGARTYHTRLAGDLLVSVTAVGAHRFGDLVMSGLRG